MHPIVLLSDFGSSDHYVYEMKSVIRRLSPGSEILDISHEVPKFDIISGSFLLYQACRYSPPGCIYVAVVDPGVGSPREAIAIRTSKGTFVGPDNGILYESARLSGIKEVRAITSKRIVMKRGGTFDGRDVFAPCAAHIANGSPFRSVGRRLEGLVKLEFRPPSLSKDKIEVMVLHTDHFGNICLNLTLTTLLDWAEGRRTFRVTAKDFVAKATLSTSFSEMKGVGLIENSSGLLDIGSYRSATGLPRLSGGELIEIHRD